MQTLSSTEYSEVISVSVDKVRDRSSSYWFGTSSNLGEFGYVLILQFFRPFKEHAYSRHEPIPISEQSSDNFRTFGVKSFRFANKTPRLLSHGHPRYLPRLPHPTHLLMRDAGQEVEAALVAHQDQIQ